MNPTEVSASIQISKPTHDVFEAIVDPSQMTNYFISKSSGRMETEALLMWEFPEFEGAYPVRVGEIIPDEFIQFYWDTDGTAYCVKIKLNPGRSKNTTVVRISESGEQPNAEKALNFIKGNTEGWANFLACLKAWLEHGINLRKGAFDFLRAEN
ncbi:MAG: SRPBCC domain-containing protein [Cryomorphaceae bacterium]